MSNFPFCCAIKKYVQWVWRNGLSSELLKSFFKNFTEVIEMCFIEDFVLPMFCL